MKLVISTIVATLVLFILGFLFYWGVFSAGYMGTYTHIMRGETEQIMWANILGFLTQGFFLSLMYQYYYKGFSPFKEGLIYGLFMGFFVTIPFFFFTWANFPLSYRAVLAESIGMGFRILIAGIVIGLVYGKKEIK